MADEIKPWKLKPGEPNLWFRRFEQFKRMGPRRSLLGCWKREKDGKGRIKSDDVPTSWREAAKKWQWQERTEAWDEYVSEREEREWEKRRKQLQNQEWELAQALMEKARKMFVFPLAETHSEKVEENGKVMNITRIVPARWSLRDAASLAEMASKLGRLATGQETETVAIDLRQAAENAGLDPDDPIVREIVKFVEAKIVSKRSSGADGGSSANGSDAPESGTGASAAGRASEA